jgi:hypothetical protein
MAQPRESPMRAYDIMYDGTSTAGPATPQFKVRATDVLSTPLTLGSLGELPPDQVDDVLLSRFYLAIQTNITNVIIQYIIGVISAIVYIVTILLLVINIFPDIGLPAAITRTKVWRWIESVPLGIWTILAAIAASMLKLLSAIKSISIYANILLGVMILMYVIKTWSCPRYLLLVAAIYTIGVGFMQLNLFGVSSIAINSMTYNIIQWNALIVVVLTLIDMVMVVPQCKRLARQFN